MSYPSLLQQLMQDEGAGTKLKNKVLPNNYAVCYTEANVADKVVEIHDFTLVVGSVVYIEFGVADTAGNCTLNVDNTGAKPIFSNGIAVTAGQLSNNRIFPMVYDGTNWEITGGAGKEVAIVGDETEVPAYLNVGGLIVETDSEYATSTGGSARFTELEGRVTLLETSANFTTTGTTNLTNQLSDINETLDSLTDTQTDYNTFKTSYADFITGYSAVSLAANSAVTQDQLATTKTEILSQIPTASETDVDELATTVSNLSTTVTENKNAADSSIDGLTTTVNDLSDSLNTLSTTIIPNIKDTLEQSIATVSNTASYNKNQVEGLSTTVSGLSSSISQLGLVNSFSEEEEEEVSEESELDVSVYRYFIKTITEDTTFTVSNYPSYNGIQIYVKLIYETVSESVITWPENFVMDELTKTFTWPTNEDNEKLPIEIIYEFTTMDSGLHWYGKVHSVYLYVEDEEEEEDTGSGEENS